jgi:hypothetical protein
MHGYSVTVSLPSPADRPPWCQASQGWSVHARARRQAATPPTGHPSTYHLRPSLHGAGVPLRAASGGWGPDCTTAASHRAARVPGVPGLERPFPPRIATSMYLHLPLGRGGAPLGCQHGALVLHLFSHGACTGLPPSPPLAASPPPQLRGGTPGTAARLTRRGPSSLRLALRSCLGVLTAAHPLPMAGTPG